MHLICCSQSHINTHTHVQSFLCAGALLPAHAPCSPPTRRGGPTTRASQGSGSGGIPGLRLRYYNLARAAGVCVCVCICVFMCVFVWVCGCVGVGVFLCHEGRYTCLDLCFAQTAGGGTFSCLSTSFSLCSPLLLLSTR